MPSKSFHRVLGAAQTPNSLWHYSGEGDGLKMWRMSAGRSETERKERRWSREERDILPSHLPSTSTLLHLMEDGRGWDRTSSRQHAKLNSKTRLLNWGMLYPWIRLHGDCEWIILWSLIKEKSEFWSGLQNVFTCKRSWYGQLFTWVQHVIQLEYTLHLFMRSSVCFCWHEKQHR